jgi:hypothetical protein
MIEKMHLVYRTVYNNFPHSLITGLWGIKKREVYIFVMINGQVLLAIGDNIAEQGKLDFRGVHRFNDDYVFQFEGRENLEVKLERHFAYIKFHTWSWNEGKLNSFNAEYGIDDKTIEGFERIMRVFIMERKLGRVDNDV